jgi:hypothetical protein
METRVVHIAERSLVQLLNYVLHGGHKVDILLTF